MIETIQTGKMDVAPIHNIECPGFQDQQIENIDIVRFAVCNADKASNRASQVHEGMELDGGFVFAERGPWKK